MKPIHIYGSKKLREKSEEVTVVDEQLLSDMEEVLDTIGGIGLAANQIGVLQRVIFLNLPGARKFLINPIILEQTGLTEDYEACLSIPMKNWPTIFRSAEIIVHYQDRELNHHESHFDGLLSRVIQHETDHLNGVLIIDLASSEWRRKNKRYLRDLRQKKIEIPYPHV